MAPHSGTPAWKIPWMEEPGRLQSMGSRRVRHDWTTLLSLFTFMHWRRKWQPTLVFLPGESQGRWSLVGCHLWGHTELDTTEATQRLQVSLTLKLTTLPWWCCWHMTCCVYVTQLCPTLCDPMGCSLPGSSVHRILQARILETVAISFSRGSSQPRDQTQVSCIAGSFPEKPIKFSSDSIYLK